MPSTTEPLVERPLSGAARVALVITTTATIALFYLFISLSILVLLVWIGLVLLVVLGLARFGLGGLVFRFVERDIRLLGLLARSLWLGEGTNYRLALQPDDAPQLFAMVQRLAERFGIPPPDELCLEMSTGAWVELRGLKTGLGTTRVGVGYDLLAGLTVQETEAVMAHELAHAKLIGRFFNNRLSRGLSRAIRVSRGLSATADAHRRSDRSFGLGEWILAGSDALTRLGARQMAAYSRQGEFEADRGAAELCGSAPLASSLQRLDRMQPVLTRLPWNERVAQIESPDGLSAWLLRELAAANPVDEADTPEVFDRYSTHPSRRDRLAALPADGSSLRDSPPGLTLLAAPDVIALKLVEAIQVTALKEERKDLRELKKWRRSLRRNLHLNVRQLPGLVLLLVGFVFGPVALFQGFWQIGLGLLLLVFPLGIWLYRLGGYRDRRAFPVPDYEVFIKARQNFPLPDVADRQKKIEEELRAGLAELPKKKARAARLIDEAYAALARADYLRAHVAARVAADFAPKSVERRLALMVAAAAFDQGDTVNGLFSPLLNETGLGTPATSWAAAWSLMLGGAWMQAEAFLHVTLKTRPDDTNLRAMLATCQSRRGKPQSAIVNIRLSCEPRPPSNQHLKLFTSLLLERGALREAAERLAAFGPASAYDPDVVQLRVQLHLLRRELAGAEKQLALLAESELTGSRLLAIGYLYENARANAKAGEFFLRSLERGHYPEALLALARHASEAKDQAKARAHLNAALDVTKPLGDRAASVYDLFPQALAQLLGQTEPVATSRAWIASFRPGHDDGPLAKRSLVVFAQTEQEVEVHFQNLLQAMKPGEPPWTGSRLNIKVAPRDLQPVRPVRPGIQYIYQ